MAAAVFPRDVNDVMPDETKEGINVRMMRTLYLGSTATDTMVGCYLTWESASGSLRVQ